MTPELAAEMAAAFTGDHPSAAGLLMESRHGDTPERRRRSWLAFLVLDLDQPIPDAWPHVDYGREAWRGTALEEPALALADLLLTTFYCTDSVVRRRAADALAWVCRQAADIRQAPRLPAA